LSVFVKSDLIWLCVWLVITLAKKLMAFVFDIINVAVERRQNHAQAIFAREGVLGLFRWNKLGITNRVH
jgi:hypothetical protein